MVSDASGVNQTAVDRDHRSSDVVGEDGRRNSTTLAQSSSLPSRGSAAYSARSRLLLPLPLPGRTLCMIRPAAMTPGATQLAVRYSVVDKVEHGSEDSWLATMLEFDFCETLIHSGARVLGKSRVSCSLGCKYVQQLTEVLEILDYRRDPGSLWFSVNRDFPVGREAHSRGPILSRYSECRPSPGRAFFGACR
jgi:hypothetical protein